MFISELLKPFPVGEMGELPVRHITDHSEGLQKGDLFFAIQGKSQDGHSYVKEALTKGAYAVVEKGEVESGIIKVSSTRKALGRATSRWYGNPSAKMNLIGVTGTNGKTTIAFLLHQMWLELGFKAGMIGTLGCYLNEKKFSSELTTPGPLFIQEYLSRMLQEKVSMVSMEVSSIALDQERTWGTNFQAGIFTNLTPDHLDYHGDMESYLEAKKKFFLEYSLPYAIFNQDDVASVSLIKAAKESQILTYSLQTPKADYFFEKIKLSPQGSLAHLKSPHGNFEFKTALLGRHNLSNALSVLAAAGVQKLSLEKCISFFEDKTGAPGRLERVSLAANQPWVYVDYAHTPDALENVLRLLKEVGGKRIFTVFGCGGDRDRSKRPLMAQAVAKYSDQIIGTSDNPRTEDPLKILEDMEKGLAFENYERIVNRKEAIHAALSQATSGDIVLIAGKGHENYQMIGNQKYPFEDRKAVLEYYQDALLDSPSSHLPMA